MLSKRNTLALVIASAVIIATLSLVIYAASSDDLQVIINSWLSGKPKAMDKLLIEVPGGPGVAYCYVSVRRLATTLEPTKDGYSQLLYFGEAPPGGLVVVRHMFNAVPVEYGVDSSGNTYIKSYEPKEYVVSVTCVGTDGRVLPKYSYTKYVNVIPTKLVNVKLVKWEPKANAVTPGTSTGGASATSACKIVITEEGRDAEGPYKKGYCYTWVAFTYLNSVPGIKVAIKFPDNPEAAVFLTAFSKHDDILGEGEWKASGKSLASFVFSTPSSGLKFVSDGDRVLVELKVEYLYEYHEVDGPDGGYIYDDQLLYPYQVYNYRLIPAGKYSEPQNHPSYANLQDTDLNIRLGPDSTEITDEVTGVTTSLTISLEGVSFTVTVNVYKAVEHNQFHSVPELVIKDYSGEYYWWWYKNNDQLTFTVLLSRQ